MANPCIIVSMPFSGREMTDVHNDVGAVDKAGFWRWRCGVLAAEVLLAGGCGFFAWRAATAPRPGPPVALHRSTGAPADVRSSAGPVWAQPTRSGSGRSHSATPPLGPDLVDRLNREDFHLYQEQWRAINVLLSGIRRYVELRLLPSLHLPAN